MSQSAKQSTIKDMTTGSPAKLILGFAIPMLMGLLFQQFYSMVDTIIVGKFLGVDALASVGSTAAINFMINGFVIGVCTGFSIPVAQRFGAQDYKDMRRFVANAGWLASFRCGYDRNRLSDDPSDPCLDADTGQYHRRCLQLYLLCLPVFRPRICTIP